MELALSSVRFGFVFIFIFVEALIDREIGNNFVDSQIEMHVTCLLKGGAVVLKCRTCTFDFVIVDWKLC